jgi:hypothetical protein
VHYKRDILFGYFVLFVVFFLFDVFSFSRKITKINPKTRFYCVKLSFSRSRAEVAMLWHLVSLALRVVRFQSALLGFEQPWNVKPA